MNRAILPVGLWLASVAISQVPCSPSWSANTFAPNGTNGGILALAVFDDGSGPGLYAGGTFTVAGASQVSNLARWNGSSWSDVGGGTNGTVNALAVFDDGTGAALYAGGVFTTAGGIGASHVARWSGSAWSSVGSGTNGDVAALIAFGGGPAASLYVGGSFTFAGGTAAANVARWSTAGWSAVGSGLPTPAPNGVRAFATYDDGTGAALYAGGLFSAGLTPNNIWKWNGSTWASVGSGIITSSTSGGVRALAVHDDGTGTALYAGGDFTLAGGVAANSVARWNGFAWSPLGVGLNGPVTALAGFDDGSGAALYASGFISTAGGSPVTGIARWSGGAWSALGGGIFGTAWAYCVHDDGSGPSLFTAGIFSSAGAVSASNIAKFTSLGWNALGADGSLSGTVNALAVFDDGSGPHLYAGGLFGAGGHVRKWGVSGWERLGSGVDVSVYALAAFDSGTGPELYAGGYFSIAGGVAANSIAKWNGGTWSAVGSGIGSGPVSSMAVFDDGSGPALYVGGFFFNAGGLPAADYFAKWDGSSWSTVGGGAFNGAVNGMAVLDFGSGQDLYVGGDFTFAGGVAANHVAKWDGTTWSPVGGGVNGSVLTLASHVSGSGPILVAGGYFTQANGVPASRVAAWNGAAWAPLGGGVDGTVRALRSFDEGAGPVLFAGGDFSSAGGAPASRLARWNGTAWSPAGDAANQPFSNLWVRALTPFDDGSGPALFVGGQFAVLGGVVSLSVARRVPGGAPSVLWPLLPQIIYPGGAITLSVTASGTQPLSYQWRKNAAVIPGANGASYPIAAAALSDGGSYSVDVMNACGMTASNAVPLSVIPGLATYGTATPGCAGLPWIGASSPPQVGNGAFSISAANLPASQSGLFAVSGAPFAGPFFVSGVAVWIDIASPVLAFIPVASDAGGVCIIPAGLPPDPGLAGAKGYVQTAWSDLCATGGLAATNALAITILP